MLGSLEYVKLFLTFPLPKRLLKYSKVYKKAKKSAYIFQPQCLTSTVLSHRFLYAKSISIKRANFNIVVMVFDDIFANKGSINFLFVDI